MGMRDEDRKGKKKIQIYLTLYCYRRRDTKFNGVRDVTLNKKRLRSALSSPLSAMHLVQGHVDKHKMTIETDVV